MCAEGVMVAEKDFAKAKHEHVEDASNLQIIMLCKSLESRGLVRSTFNWCGRA
jgi:small subunit ribosomal protein S10e